MERRSALRRLGLVTTAPFLAACAKTFRIPLATMAKPASGAGADRDPDGVWREGAAYARWTPSPHNVQPWRLRILSSTTGELYYDPTRLLPKTDPTSAFTIIGLSMFVEYLSIAVRPRGYEVIADYVAKPLDYAATKPTLFAQLTLRPCTDAAVDRLLVLERKTSRLPYDGNPIETVALGALAAIADRHGHRMESSSDHTMVDWTLDLNRFTLFSDLDDPEARGELRKWIRPSDEEAAKKKDGLWSECMRFPGWLFQSFFDSHQKYMGGWRRALTGKLLIHGMRGTRTVAWWSGPFDTAEDWIRCGRVLGQSWLELAGRGIQMHPFGSVITNPSAYAKFVEKIGPAPRPGRAWLLVRLGRSDLAPRSYRLEEPAIFLDDRELS